MAADRQFTSGGRATGLPVTEEHLREQLANYGPGLEAEVAILRQLVRLGAEQREALEAEDNKRIEAITRERDRSMAALVTIEHTLRPVRHELAANREMAAAIEGFAEISELHEAAAGLVAEIAHSDEDTLGALREAESARRFAADTLAVAGSTLAAYRRVVSPPVTGAGLVDRRG